MAPLATTRLGGIKHRQQLTQVDGTRAGRWLRSLLPKGQIPISLLTFDRGAAHPRLFPLFPQSVFQNRIWARPRILSQSNDLFLE